MVRPYVTADATRLSVIHHSVFPGDMFTPHGFHDYVTKTCANGGSIWVIESPSVTGYALVAQVPGLPGVMELDGCIAPDHWRKGLGSRLLMGMIAALRGSKVRQITYHVESLDDPAALFLMHNNFFVEHEEWLMVYEGEAAAAEQYLKNEIAIQTYPSHIAVPLFCKIYEQSFSGLPWDQPYDHGEVAATLDSGEDLLFLTAENEDVGVVWIRVDSESKGVIEPLAVVPAYQGRGYGRYLLAEAINALRQRHVRRIELGTWRDNVRAIDLYHSMGFRHYQTIRYLALNLT